MSDNATEKHKAQGKGKEAGGEKGGGSLLVGFFEEATVDFLNI